MWRAAAGQSFSSSCELKNPSQQPVSPLGRARRVQAGSPVIDLNLVARHISAWIS
jgi:hypothetical protein